MRRLFTIAAMALCLAGGALGCGHTAGICDCDQGDGPCCYGPHQPSLISEPMQFVPGQGPERIAPRMEK